MSISTKSKEDIGHIRIHSNNLLFLEVHVSIYQVFAVFIGTGDVTGFDEFTDVVDLRFAFGLIVILTELQELITDNIRIITTTIHETKKTTTEFAQARICQFFKALFLRRLCSFSLGLRLFQGVVPAQTL